MAQSITSVKALTQVSAAEFVSQAVNGDLLFCDGRNVIDDGIDKVTGSIWSHVAIIWFLPEAQVWVVLEATATHGVSFSTLDSYLKTYNGGIALAHRPVLSDADRVAAYKAGIEVLDDSYNFLQIGEFLLKRFLRFVKIEDSQKQFVCSALVNYEYQHTTHPLQLNGVPTPQQVWAEASVVPKYALGR
jgi:hypothetical protein